MSSNLNVGGWLRGKTVRKGALNTRSSTPQAIQSTSTTVFGGGVKDASGRTSEFFVSWSTTDLLYLLISFSPWMTSVQYAKVIVT
jgi:hypothetical protein